MIRRRVSSGWAANRRTADALKHMGGQPLRFFFLGTHYRSQIDLGVWDWKDPAKPLPEGMVAAKRAFDTFARFAERVTRITGKGVADAAPFDPDSRPPILDYFTRFRQFMDDDFNTGGAVGVVFELVTFLNRTADAGNLESPNPANAPSQTFAGGVSLFKFFAHILGLSFTADGANLGGELVNGLMHLLLDLRANLRTTAKEAAKDNPLKKALFDQTDLIRQRLADLGVTLEDRPTGTTWRLG